MQEGNAQVPACAQRVEESLGGQDAQQRPSDGQSTRNLSRDKTLAQEQGDGSGVGAAWMFVQHVQEPSRKGPVSCVKVTGEGSHSEWGPWAPVSHCGTIHTLAGFVCWVTRLPDTPWPLYWLVQKLVPDCLVIPWEDCFRHVIPLQDRPPCSQKVHRRQVNPCGVELMQLLFGASVFSTVRW